MRAVLQSFERGQTSYNVDSRMRPSISKLEELHEPSTTVIETTARRGTTPVPFGIQHCRQLSVDKEAGEGGATDFLCQQGAPERRASVPTLGAASTGPGRLGTKTSPLLPGSRNHSSDEPASSAGAPKAGNIWPIGQMGNRVERAIADFISELTPPALSESSSPSAVPAAPEKMDTERFDTSAPLWILHVDGSANQQGCGAVLVLTTPDGSKIEYALRFNFRTSNNEAEYEALLAGLWLAQSMSARQISIHSDSQLIVNQITADFAAKDASMSAYLSATHQLLQKFQAYEIRQIPRLENSHADALSRLASAINDKIGRKVPVEILSQPSTTAAEVCTIRYEDTWMSPIYAYLTAGTLPTDKSQTRKLRYRSARYTVINDVLYKRGYTTSYLKCVTKEQGDYILREVHSGICGDHSGSRSLANKVFRQGYFWPTLH
ncbi:unnamed protein product [Prunus armeniaca]